MPVVWDRRCRSWLGDDHRMATTEEKGGHRGKQDYAGGTNERIRDTTSPPARKKPLLDDGQGEILECTTVTKTDVVNCVDLPATTSDGATSAARPTTSHRTTCAGHRHSTLDAGTNTAPSSHEDNRLDPSHSKTTGLNPPSLGTEAPVTGAMSDALRKANKQTRISRQLNQELSISHLRTYRGNATLPASWSQERVQHRNHMCPAGLALHHPAAEKLLQYATKGCPVRT
eukprot:CCRYP_003718-RA/>CCRYP_003718-RA protein AED:0.00 eAED:0.00 QI:500/1/0.5/1/0/0/2/0/228